MFEILRVGKSFTALSILLFFMTVTSAIIYQKYTQTKEELFVIVQDYIVDEKLRLLEHYSADIKSAFGVEFLYSLNNKLEIREEYEQKMRLLQGEDIKYLYLLYKDESQKFRYILDATLDKEQKAEYKQKFNPQTDIWERAYASKKFQLTKQKNLDTLWVTLAYPIVLNDQVVAVLGADFTYDVYIKIVEILNPMDDVYFYAMVFMVVLLLFVYTLMYMYYSSRKRSFIDPLTKVYNRQYLEEFHKNISLKEYKIMMIDLDKFKKVNDTYGHDAGDKVLESVVHEMSKMIRTKDKLIRFGGEEFLLFVHNQEVSNAIEMAQRLRKSISQHSIHIDKYTITITISIGINPFPHFAADLESAIKIADEQLYLAKSLGRNRVEVYSEGNKEESVLSKRISDVQLAIDQQRIKCMFQPIYSTEDMKLVKYEVLVRLIDMAGRVVSPQEFLPFIKRTNVYVNITRIVIDTAIKVLEENDFELTINLDIQDILDDAIMKLFEEKFTKKKELSSRLCIEILEHEEISNFKLIESRLVKLKELGFKIALDDFGSGYANFSYLVHLNLDILKIDGSLIRDIDVNKDIYNILEGISSLAKSLRVVTIAEQVETQGELELLKKVGIDYIQGYHLGRPSFEFVDLKE